MIPAPVFSGELGAVSGVVTDASGAMVAGTHVTAKRNGTEEAYKAETAVASVVAVEGAPGAPWEALKAQAIAVRSYFVAGKGRHHIFDFCDTTHCQLVREPPAADAPAARATTATRGLVLAYQRQPFAAMYTRSCGGRTRTPAELGMRTGAYPYYPVDCRYCREHPSRWQTQVSAREADSLQKSGESARLQIDRLFGWNFVRSNNFSTHSEGGHVLLDGTGQGHGIGLCQAGAAAMAQAGATFRGILAYYYPNTTIASESHRVSGASVDTIHE